MASRRIYDCFTFFNELDLLELRLNELASVVDYFVIAEATHTFTGKPKPLHFKENAARFEAFLPRIIHIIVEDFSGCKTTWDRENLQRESLSKGLVGASSDDLIMLSDVDEIPRASSLQEIKGLDILPSDVWCLQLAWHIFYLDVCLKQKWDRLGPRLIRADALHTMYGLRRVVSPANRWSREFIRFLKACARMRRIVRRRVAHDAGWHFTWLGGMEAVAVKGSCLSEHSNLKPGDKDLDWARRRVEAALGARENYDIVKVDSTFPEYVHKRPDLFEKYLIKPV